MEEVVYKGKEYYIIKKKTFWFGAIMLISVMAMALFRMYYDVKEEVYSDEYKESYHIEYGSLDSKLENVEECYLCGNTNRSLMGYYRKFDTIGIIGLNEWCIIDFRLKAHDENGNEMVQRDSSNTLYGNSQGVDYYINSTPLRGMATAIVSSDNGTFDEKIIRQNLCQKCLDKVTDTLETYCKVGEKKEYVPFCVVDFDTLKLYPLQTQNLGYFVRDYWIDIEHDEGEIKVQVFYLPAYQ